MAESGNFDAYYKWLGIPPSEQPPTHYRLLGLVNFEEDSDVIDSAANRQLAYLQQCSTGEHIARAQEMMTELSAARLVLLNPQKKKKYDAKLKAKLKQEEKSEEVLTDIPFTPAPTIDTNSTTSSTSPRRRKSSQGMMITFGLFGGMITALALWFLVFKPDGPPEEDPPPRTVSLNQTDKDDNSKKTPTEKNPKNKEKNNNLKNNSRTVATTDNNTTSQKEKEEQERAFLKNSYSYNMRDGDRIRAQSISRLLNKKTRLKASFDYKEGDEGVIFALGGNKYGYSLFVEDGQMQMCIHHNPRNYVHIPVGEKLASGQVDVQIDWEPSGVIETRINGETTPTVTKLTPEQSLLAGLPIEGVEIGEDAETPVSNRYNSPFNYTGSIGRVYLIVAKSASGTTSPSVVAETTNSLGMTLVRIQEGEFQMGTPPANLSENDEFPAHQVEISQPFYMSQTEVTQSQFEKIMGRNPSKHLNPLGPVENVTWAEANEFCKQLGIQEGREYRLPTEAEWEYAARGNSMDLFSFGSQVSQLTEYAIHKLNSNGKTAAVKTLKPNSFKLYDVHGNVAEWCQDWYDPLYYSKSPATDPPGPTLSQYRVPPQFKVIRGGDFNSVEECKSAFRGAAFPDDKSDAIGFRVVLLTSRDGGLPNMIGESQASLTPNSNSTTTNSSTTTSTSSSVPSQPTATLPNLEPTPLSESYASFAATKAGEQKVVGPLKLRVAWCPAGSFQMGRPSTYASRFYPANQVQVQLTKGFWMGQLEVRQGLWMHVMKTDPWSDKMSSKSAPDYPAVYISHADATAFCAAVTKRGHSEGWLGSEWAIQLPTEAQWEYAARAGSTSRFITGDNSVSIGEYAWFRDNTYALGEKYPHRAGTKKTNAWSLYDMTGNVYEWCADWWNTQLPGGRDPIVTAEAQYRVRRGGVYDNSMEDQLSLFWRSNSPPDTKKSDTGFRFAIVPVSSSPAKSPNTTANTTPPANTTSSANYDYRGLANKLKPSLSSRRYDIALGTLKTELETATDETIKANLKNIETQITAVQTAMKTVESKLQLHRVGSEIRVGGVGRQTFLRYDPKTNTVYNQNWFQSRKKNFFRESEDQ